MDIKRFKAWAESKKLSTDGETGRNYSYTFYDSKTRHGVHGKQPKLKRCMKVLFWCRKNYQKILLIN